MLPLLEMDSSMVPLEHVDTKQSIEHLQGVRALALRP